MSKRTLLGGSVAVGLLAAAAGRWAAAGRPSAGSSVALQTPSPLPARAADVPSQPPADAVEPHFDWVTARPDAVALIDPAPLWATADLRDMLPPAVASWLTHYNQSLRSNDSSPVTPAQIAELESLLKKVQPPASASAATWPGETLAFWSGPDPSDRAATGRLGLTAAERELADLTPGDPATGPTVLAIGRLPEGRWWDARDGASLERLFALRTRWTPADSETNAWALVGRPAALYLQHRSTEGLAANDALMKTKWNRLTESQRIDVHWHQGVLLSDLKRFQAALPFVQEAAHARSFHHAPDASKLLFSLLLQNNDLAGAERQLQAYCREWTPSREKLQEMNDELADRRWLLAHTTASRRSVTDPPALPMAQ